MNKLELRLQKLNERKANLEDRLYNENLRESQMLSNRGWGYGMRHTKIGFSTRKSDHLKEQIKRVNAKIAELQQVR